MYLNNEPMVIEYLGNLKEIFKKDFFSTKVIPQGHFVYLWLYKNKFAKSRIAYIGTTADLKQRFNDHYENTYNGNYTYFFPQPDEDIYDLMKPQVNKTNEDLKKWYLDLKANKKMYWKDKTEALTKEEKMEFRDNYLSLLVEDEFSNYEVFYLNTLPFDPKIVETKFQLQFRNEIGYYRKDYRFSWIGKIELSEEQVKPYIFDIKLSEEIMKLDLDESFVPCLNELNMVNNP